MATSPSSSHASGGGLPSQWTNGGHGNVIVATDDRTTEPLVIVGTNSQNADFFRVATNGGTNAIRVQADGLGNASTIVLRTNDPGAGGLIRFLTDEVNLGSIDLTPTLLGFYGASPVARPAAIADAAGGAVQDTQARTALNALLAAARLLGLIAT